MVNQRLTFVRHHSLIEPSPQWVTSMTARYAIYDPGTDKDFREVADLREAYVEIDRLTELDGTGYSVRLARQYREQVEQEWEVRKVRAATLERAFRGL